MNLKTLCLGTIGICIVGITAIMVDIWHDNDQTNRKIGESLKSLKDLTSRDISDAMIKEAVQKAASERTDHYIHQDNDGLMASAKQKLTEEINKTVSLAYITASENAAEKVDQQIEALGRPEDIRERIMSGAKDIMARRFSSDLDALRRDASNKIDDTISDITDKFKEKMDDKLESLGESVKSAKAVYDAIGNGLGIGKKDNGFRIVVG